MNSPKRIAANRRNAARSTGPRTPEGKSRSRFNALKHGRAAKLPVLPGEDAEAYQGRLDAWTAALKPRDDRERALVEQAARACWQLERAELIQEAILTERIRVAVAENPQLGEAQAAALAFDDSDEGERMRQYQLARTRAINRALHALLKERRARGSEPPAAPLPAGLESTPAPPETRAPRDPSAPRSDDDRIGPTVPTGGDA